MPFISADAGKYPRTEMGEKKETREDNSQGKKKTIKPLSSPLASHSFFPYHAFSIALLLAHQSAEDMKPTGYKLLFKTRYK